MKALTCAGYEYMKLIVAELQRQLNEIQGNRKNTSETINSPPKPPPRRQNPFNRPAPPPPASVDNRGNHVNIFFVSSVPPVYVWIQILFIFFLNSVFNGGGNGTSQLLSQSNANTSIAADATKQIEFNFQIVHEAYGREIMKDLKQRELNKEQSQRPLIELWNQITSK